LRAKTLLIGIAVALALATFNPHAQAAFAVQAKMTGTVVGDRGIGGGGVTNRPTR
jgi:hypothetical protein